MATEIDRSAAERFAAITDDEASEGDLQGHTGRAIVDGWQEFKAAQEIVKRWLSEHPADDDERVTEEWLRSCGGNVYMSYPRRIQLETLPGMYLAWDLDDEVLLLHGLYVPDKTTRGDVRRIFQALGETLEEPTVPQSSSPGENQ